MPMTYSRINSSTHGSATNGGAGLSGLLNSAGRFSVLIISAFIGLGVLIFTASAALVLFLTILFLGVVAFGFFWVRAKIFGKPFRNAQFEAYRQAAQSPFGAPFGQQLGPDTHSTEGDVLDAVQTPDGWTVEK